MVPKHGSSGTGPAGLRLDENVQLLRPGDCDRVVHHEHQRESGDIENVGVYFNHEGNTLSSWFDDPKNDYVCEESDDDVLVKDQAAGPRAWGQ